MRAYPRSGVLVLDKPRGPTSHDIVARVRRRLGMRAVGHAGTLDPMATGVLVVTVGEATKLVPWLSAHDKAYEATIALGVETDTLDADGRVVRRVPPDDDLLHALANASNATVPPRLRAALERERARTTQVPPAYSAIKTHGERAFERARRGEATDLKARSVRVQRVDLVAWGDTPPRISVTVEASKGYYVRALARDLAEALGTVAHLTSLRRTRAGCFVLGEAVDPEEADVDWLACLQPIASAAARALPVARLTDIGTLEARHGRPVPPTELVASTRLPSAWMNPRGELVAIGEVDDEGRGRVLRGFTELAG